MGVDLLLAAIEQMQTGALMKQLLFPAVLLALLSQACGFSALAQETVANATPGSNPQLGLSPLKTLEKFEPAVNEQYELGPGDEISLDFPGRPELSGKRVVGPDGRITLPLAGPISVADKTRTETARAVVDALSDYYQDLTVTVNIDKYGSNRIVLIGAVKNPGVLYFDTTPTLLDVIARGGLMPAPAGGAASGSGAGVSNAAVVRDGIPNRCAIYRGNDQVIWVDLKMLLQSGNSMADMRLRRNDIIFVPSEQQVFVSVLGSVGHPGAIAITPESTLTSILAQAGGLTEGASSKVQVIQPSTGKTTTVSFKSLVSLKGVNEVSLHGGDVVYVPASGFYKATYVIQRISPGATLGLATAAAQ
jgi:polysaccharide export outer membrane protein